MEAACTIQDSIHVFSLVRKYVSMILGTYQYDTGDFLFCNYMRAQLYSARITSCISYIPAGFPFKNFAASTAPFPKIAADVVIDFSNAKAVDEL